MARGNTLSPEVRRFIVCANARFDSPSIVVDAVKEEFDVVISRQLVQAYDPTKYMGRHLAKKWRALFDETRAKFIADTSTIATTHKATRVAMLERMARRAEAKGNHPLAAQLLKQIAEEMGGAYTNRREHTGKDGAPLPNSPGVVLYLPDNGRDG